MKQELTSVGFEDLTTAEEVREAIQEMPAHFFGHQPAYAVAQPVMPARCQTESAAQQDPDRLATVFADSEWNRKLKRKLTSPSAVFSRPWPCSRTVLVHFIERHQIEGHNAAMVAENLMKAYDKHC